MKLLMENWRRYVAESEQSEIYGKMYLFEDDNIREISFYDHLNQLNENDDDVDHFLERWEQSVDHMLEHLNEQTGASAIDDAVLLASTQAWLTLDKLKGKAVAPVLNVIKKLKNYGKENPNAAKAIKITVGALAAATAAVGVYTLMKTGADASGVQELSQAISVVEPDVAQDVAEVAQNFTPEAAAELISNQEQTVSQVADTLAASGDAGLEKLAQATENAQSEFEQMMGDLEAEKEAPTAAGAEDAFDPDSDTGRRGAGGEQIRRGDIYHYDADASANDSLRTAGYPKMADWLNDKMAALPPGPRRDVHDQWIKYREFANTFAEGGNLGDLGISDSDFKQWMADSQDKGIRRVAGGKSLDLTRIGAGGPMGHIPKEAMKWLEKIWRTSRTTQI